MRIFKHRGDIYFSKVNKEKSNEQRILIIALVAIVSFTVIFMGVVSAVNDFSVKKFFEPDNLEDINASTQYTYDEVDLPEVSGKYNFATMVYEDNSLLFVAITQIDLDTTSYKSALLKGGTELDGTTLERVFIDSGAANTVNAIESYLGIDIDYYISMKSLDFKDFYNDLGSIRYPILNDIKYKNNDSPVSYSLKIDAGEQSIDGKEFVNIIRYYLDNDSTSLANELYLAHFSQQFNLDNYEDREDLFKTFSAMSETNITIRDFSQAGDELLVISHEQTSMGVYNASVNYENNKITEDSLKSVKGYFVK